MKRLFMALMIIAMPIVANDAKLNRVVQEKKESTQTIKDVEKPEESKDKDFSL